MKLKTYTSIHHPYRKIYIKKQKKFLKIPYQKNNPEHFMWRRFRFSK